MDPYPTSVTSLHEAVSRYLPRDPALVDAVETVVREWVRAQIAELSSPDEDGEYLYTADVLGLFDA